MSSLEFYIPYLKQELSKRGWCVVSNNWYFGITGYYKKELNKDGSKKVRDDHIVSIAEYVDYLPYPLSLWENMWEVKTHWTVKRNIFKDAGLAVDMFLQESRKYKVNKIKWSRL